MIERRRPQLRGQALDHGDANLDQADERLEPIHDGRIETDVFEGRGGASELELERRQRLAEIVVELAREIRALFFAGRLQAGGELPHLFLRRAQLDDGRTFVRETVVELGPVMWHRSDQPAV